VRDTTEGPTPETRIANRAADDTDDTAAGQPAADARTRMRLRRYSAGERFDDRPRIDESPRR
jgi:hypothetical protein